MKTFVYPCGLVNDTENHGGALGGLLLLTYRIFEARDDPQPVGVKLMHLMVAAVDAHQAIRVAVPVRIVEAGRPSGAQVDPDVCLWLFIPLVMMPQEIPDA